MKEGKCTKTFVKIRVSETVLPKFIQLCIETTDWCPSEGNQHGGQKQKNLLPMNSSFAEIINMKLVLFLLQKLFRWKKYPKISHLFMTFILHDNFLGRHVKLPCHPKGQKFKLLRNEEPFRSESSKKSNTLKGKTQEDRQKEKFLGKLIGLDRRSVGGGQWSKILIRICGSTFHVFLRFSPASSTKSCSFCYGLKGYFPCTSLQS